MTKINLLRPKWGGAGNRLAFELQMMSLWRGLHNYYSQFTEEELHEMVYGNA